MNYNNLCHISSILEIYARVMELVDILDFLKSGGPQGVRVRLRSAHPVWFGLVLNKILSTRRPQRVGSVLELNTSLFDDIILSVLSRRVKGA